MSDSKLILLVDDEEIVHQTLVPYLHDLGHRVAGARVGGEALDKIRSESFDLALIDVHIMGLDGLSLMGEILELDPDLPVIIISGHGDEDIRRRAEEMGAALFMEKPISLIALEEVIGKLSRRC